jgi:hypothetical protein
MDRALRRAIEARGQRDKTLRKRLAQQIAIHGAQLPPQSIRLIRLTPGSGRPSGVARQTAVGSSRALALLSSSAIAVPARGNHSPSRSGVNLWYVPQASAVPANEAIELAPDHPVMGADAVRLGWMRAAARPPGRPCARARSSSHPVLERCFAYQLADERTRIGGGQRGLPRGPDVQFR